MVFEAMPVPSFLGDPVDIVPMSHAQFCLVSHLGCPIYTNTECIYLMSQKGFGMV